MAGVSPVTVWVYGVAVVPAPDLPEGGGCCRVAGAPRAPVPPLGTMLVVAGSLALLFRRRRTRR